MAFSANRPPKEILLSVCAEGSAAAAAAGILDGATFTNLSVTVSGAVVSGQREFRNDLTRQLGIERVLQNYEVEYRDGLWVRVTVTPSLGDAETGVFLAALAAQAAPDGLPNAGSGGLANETGSNTGLAMGLASALAAVVVLAGGSARLARKRRC